MGMFVNPDNSGISISPECKSILDEEKLIWNAFAVYTKHSMKLLGGAKVWSAIVQ